jgi:hypothetical protein
MRGLPDIPRPLEISPENEGKSGLSGVSKNFPKTFCGNLIVFPGTSPNLWGFQGARYHVYIVEFYTTLGMAPGGN